VSRVLPPELERRIAALEDPENQVQEFDRASWDWLYVLGGLLPLILLIAGWFN
jgi:hypothetical protein